MKTIPLTRGHVALVDDEDFEMLSKWTWCIGQAGTGYYAKAYNGGGAAAQRFAYMHRIIMDLVPGDGVEVDHINHDGLDNRRRNLRVCSHKENARNVSIGRANTSGFKGVSWDRSRNKWGASIKVDGRKLHLGRFACLRDAVREYDSAAVRFFGPFAKTNAAEGVSR